MRTYSKKQQVHSVSKGRASICSFDHRIMPSTRHKVALSFLEGFKTLSVEKLLANRTNYCKQVFAPLSLGVVQDNETFASHIQHLQEVIETFPVTAKEVVEDEKENKVVIWASSTANFYESVKDAGLAADEWTYHGEYVFMLSMTADGEQIERIVEFVDTSGTKRLQGLIKRARENIEKAKSGT